ncbi:hypothetical protein Acr_17g0010250 [Actinidia rufa]|uniref:Reverse transcriptase Ty1/copia-type domain-containing protein n=1 Tax=Actinidia rufa TaxID=165716 RepID=A0A7J0G3U1_9ERIC|nr:hypothetical protein Acr_17g0010250 [Actinidia rufa]
MFHARVPLPLWVEAFSIAVYLINRLPSQTLDGKTPYELLFGKQPDYSMLRTFGCLCFPYLRDYAPNKLSPKSSPCVFLGYSPLHKGFRCFDRKTQRLYVSRHVQFYETIFPYAGNNIQQLPNSTPYITFSDFLESNNNVPPASPNLLSSSPILDSNCLPCSDDLGESFPQTSPVVSPVPSPSPPTLRISTPTTSTNTHSMITRGKVVIFKPKAYHALEISFSSQYFQALFALKEPRGFKSAVKHPEWLSAMDDEIQALKKNDTWDLVPRPRNHNVADSSLFVHHSTAGTVYLLLYVDDMVLTGNNPALIKTLITRLSTEFAMKDLGSLHYFLGVEVQPNFQGLFLSQSKYALDLLQRADMIEAKPITTPFVVGYHLSTEGKLFSDPTLFPARSIMVSNSTAPPLCSKKQSTVSRSSAEAKYRSLAVATAEVAWIVQLLRDLRLQIPSPPKILCDNKSAIFMAVNPVTRPRSKHIAIDYHFVRELIANGSLKVTFVPSHLQLADSFTKGVTKPQFLLFRNKLHVIPFATLSLKGGDKEESSSSSDSFLDLR